ncbi:hypothetical protein BD769DRAFT_1653347 [Suillus cothurnatus]|nr:hypothetical protein BD769DRAFT_1653347 [Suillus cothurnatus]
MSSAYMWSVSPPPNLPAKLRRKSSSASINASSISEPDDDYDLESPSPVTSPLPSSSPLSTPICSSPPNHIVTRYTHSRSQFQNSCEESHLEFDDAPGSPTPLYHRSRTSKYLTHQHVSDKYGSYPDSEDEADSEPYRSDDLRAWLGPPYLARDVQDDVGCDPESVDIHLRRTYFATSSERGRWQSSPVMPRTYNAKSFTASPIRPHRGHSTPVKSNTRDAKSPLLEFRDFVRRQSTSGVKDDPSSSPFLAASDSNDIEDYRSLSPLPPSSPPTSPMSLAPSQPDDCALIDDDMVLNDDCNSDNLNLKQQNIHSAPRDVPTSDPEAPSLLASKHALNAASTACLSSCTNEATHQPLKLALTVPAPINTITPTSTTKIEPSRSHPHSPTGTLLGLSAYTNIPAAITPPHLSEEEMGLTAKNTTSSVVDVRMVVDAQVGRCDNFTSQSMRIRVSSDAVVSAGTNPVDPLLATSTAIPHSPLKTVKKPRPSFSDGEFVQGAVCHSRSPRLHVGAACRVPSLRTKPPV